MKVICGSYIQFGISFYQTFNKKDWNNIMITFMKFTYETRIKFISLKWSISKMFSQSFYTFISKSLELITQLGGSSLTFDDKAKIFLNDSKHLRLNLKYNLLLVWSAGAIIMSAKFWFIDKNINQFNISVCYANCIIFATTLFSINRWHSQTLCMLHNGLLGLLKYFRKCSKFEVKLQFKAD
ncbi:unnamed protein product [Orchesella dallaii]|uniref:Uncharacterized protein n=1 Tax=Orchesella dallaii TaxID=48710 RepID=A0ABP1QW38_9HEXA